MDEVRQVIRRLRREHLLRDGARLSDGQLLERFVAQRDDAAFEALVELHGPMVFGVCRRILRHSQDAEDAFQATFLVFARKAASIGRRERLANWLFGVARRTALKSRSLNARRAEKQKPLGQMPEPPIVATSADAELEGWLDYEISRLPDKYRVPILICDLEGRPQTEAAQQLGCLPGTLSVRLSRARADVGVPFGAARIRPLRDSVRDVVVAKYRLGQCPSCNDYCNRDPCRDAAPRSAWEPSRRKYQLSPKEF